MDAVKARYRALSGRDQKMLLLLLFFVVLAGYTWGAGAMWGELTEQRRGLKGDRYDHQQLLDDMQLPALQPGITPARLQQLRQEQQQYEIRLRALSQRLLPLHESGPREHLKLELTRLAEQENLKVVRFHTEGTELRRLPSALEGAALRQYLLQRPVLTLHMTGHYFDLVAFLDDLQMLSWQVRIGDMVLENRSGQGDLSIQLELKL